MRAFRSARGADNHAENTCALADQNLVASSDMTKYKVYRATALYAVMSVSGAFSSCY